MFVSFKYLESVFWGSVIHIITTSGRCFRPERFLTRALGHIRAIFLPGFLAILKPTFAQRDFSTSALVGCFLRCTRVHLKSLYGKFWVYLLTQGLFDHGKNKIKWSKLNFKGVLGAPNIVFAKLNSWLYPYGSKLCEVEFMTMSICHMAYGSKLF